ncbi:MAG: hypothetical protein LIO69_03575 [Oscillospiraceae bacterium]|nr:hypothetical protein [Oscillospiraceae bacterium]
MEYGMIDVYDEKTGKYIGRAGWRRPTDEITPEERKRRQERFNEAAFKLIARAREEEVNGTARPPRDPIKAVKIPVTQEVKDNIDEILDRHPYGRRKNERQK